jgi:surface antigen
MNKALLTMSCGLAALILVSCSNHTNSAPSAVEPIVPVAAVDETDAAATPADPNQQAVPNETPTTTTDAGTTSTPVGNGMSASDQNKLSHALDAPLGQPTSWVSESNGTSYTVVPTTKVTINGNPYCRKYNVKAERAGRSSAYTSTACVSSDSSWKVATETGN